MPNEPSKELPMPEDPAFKSMMDRFMKQVEDDVEDEWAATTKSHVLAAVQDVKSNAYIIVMAVPSSAFADGVGPELFATPNKNRFIGGISQDVLYYKAEQIEKENPDSTIEERDDLMAEFISSFMPELLERAASMPELDI